MKYLKLFEDIERLPKIDDWIIINAEHLFKWGSWSEDSKKYINNNIFKIIDTDPIQINFPGISNGIEIRLEDISSFGTKEEMNMILDIDKYNL